jgi:phage gp36-like protein
MSYASQSDMVDRFGESEVAQRTNRVDGLTIDPAVLSRALDDADAQIDSYMATRYTLPLATTPTVLVRLACDMARYALYDDGVPETVRQRYEDAVSLLKKFASGDVKIVGQDAAATAGVETVQFSFASRQVTDDTMRGFA